MPATRAPLPLAALAALVLAAGCGGGSPHPAAHGGATSSASASSVPKSSVKALARSVPVRVRIPDIGVDAPVTGLGLNADGTVQVPPVEAHDPAGWYRSSPTPGQVGPSVILGHVTVGRYGDGVFVHLARLRRGDRVEVRLRDGETPVFTVDSTQKVAKASFPTDAVYGNVDHPELRLITCGGTRNAQVGGYPDNVIVYASLTAATR